MALGVEMRWRAMYPGCTVECSVCGIEDAYGGERACRTGVLCVRVLLCARQPKNNSICVCG